MYDARNHLCQMYDAQAHTMHDTRMEKLSMHVHKFHKKAHDRCTKKKALVPSILINQLNIVRCTCSMSEDGVKKDL